MSWIRSSESAVVLALLVALVGATGGAFALSTSAENVPSNTTVGNEVSATVTVADPFADAPSQWELQGETELRNVSWTVTVLDQGQQVDQRSYGGQSFSQALARAQGGDEVQIEVTGTVPEIQNYTYDPAESTDVARLSRRTGDNTQEIGNWTTRPYTSESQEARNAIDTASRAIDNAGGSQSAERSLQQAISAYNSEDFDAAISNAEDARNAAQGAQQTQMLLYGAVGIVIVVVVVGGGIWYYRNQQDDYDKLR
ncbi:hypothetical protein [Halorientalis litorea]|uniref:hypothetical protein n=1 Tax=Halorientalis litorea TaxID=2931977 RepID=UPI001FF5FF9D|nr:hypothetical protein [Halorientalis litorea]